MVIDLKSNFTVRLLSGIAMIGILYALLIFSNINIYCLYSVLFFFNSLLLYELLLMFNKNKIQILGLILPTILSFFVINYYDIILNNIILLLIVIMFSTIILFRSINLLSLALYLTIIILLLFELFYIHSIFIILILLNSCSDTFAYIFGKWCGGRKLIPSISANKTYSGAIISTLLISVLCVIINDFYNILLIDNYIIIILAICLSILSQLGDIFVSYIKRKCNVKDSSSIIPGHGGLFDRFDSYMFTIPFFYFVIVCFDK